MQAKNQNGSRGQINQTLIVLVIVRLDLYSTPCFYPVNFKQLSFDVVADPEREGKRDWLLLMNPRN